MELADNLGTAADNLDSQDMVAALEDCVDIQGAGILDSHRFCHRIAADSVHFVAVDSKVGHVAAADNVAAVVGAEVVHDAVAGAVVAADDHSVHHNAAGLVGLAESDCHHFPVPVRAVQK